MFVQTLMLAAVSRGLATCPQAVWASWPLTLARHLELPPEQIVFAGLSLGYPDCNAPLNTFRTEREPVPAFTTFRGFCAILSGGPPAGRPRTGGSPGTDRKTVV